MLPGDDAATGEAARMRAVLTQNPHLARSVCFVMTVGGLPAYIVTPTAREVLTALVDSVGSSESDRWDLLIGRLVGVAGPTNCGGILAPMVAADQIYTFTTPELVTGLIEQAGPVIDDKRTAVLAWRDARLHAFRSSPADFGPPCVDESPAVGLRRADGGSTKGHPSTLDAT
jgi:hypothetical protein